MRRQSKLNSFALSVDNKKLSISKDENTLEFTPGEGDKLATLGGILLRLRGLPAYPAEIKNTPFTATINDGISITHNARGGVLNISWNELDTFVEAVYSINNMSNDILKLTARPAVPTGGIREGLSH